MNRRFIFNNGRHLHNQGAFRNNVAYPKCQLKDEPLKRIELLVRKLNAIRGKSITYSQATEGLDSTKLLEVAEKKSSHGRRKGKVRTP